MGSNMLLVRPNPYLQIEVFLLLAAQDISPEIYWMIWETVRKSSARKNSYTVLLQWTQSKIVDGARDLGKVVNLCPNSRLLLAQYHETTAVKHHTVLVIWG